MLNRLPLIQVQSMDSIALKAQAEGPELVNLKQTETPLLYRSVSFCCPKYDFDATLHAVIAVLLPVKICVIDLCWACVACALQTQQ